MAELIPAAPGSPERYWQDYEYLTGRRKPTGSVHCQAHHDQLVALRRPGADRPGYSVRLRPSDKRHCTICGGGPHA